MRRLAKAKTARAIAAVLGRSLSSIERYAQHHKISLRKYGDDNPDTKYSDALVELVRQMNEQGMSARRIADALGLSVGSAKNFVHYRARLTPASVINRGNRMSAAADLSTFWILYGKYGPVMSMEQLRETFFPRAAMKTVADKASAGLLAKRAGEVFDTRDVADWWDDQRRAGT